MTCILMGLDNEEEIDMKANQLWIKDTNLPVDKTRILKGYILDNR